MTPLLAVLLMFAGPIVGGIVLGCAQLGWYRLRRAAAPPFFILFARGLLATFALAAVLALGTRLG
jgi:hypothetical protein